MASLVIVLLSVLLVKDGLSLPLFNDEEASNELASFDAEFNNSSSVGNASESNTDFESNEGLSNDNDLNSEGGFESQNQGNDTNVDSEIGADASTGEEVGSAALEALNNDTSTNDVVDGESGDWETTQEESNQNEEDEIKTEDGETEAHNDFDHIHILKLNLALELSGDDIFGVGDFAMETMKVEDMGEIGDGSEEGAAAGESFLFGGDDAEETEGMGEENGDANDEIGDDFLMSGSESEEANANDGTEGGAFEGAEGEAGSETGLNQTAENATETGVDVNANDPWEGYYA